ncbi:hypothetical protein EMIT0P12_10989 [Pseudomonas sp. IT-P12]
MGENGIGKTRIFESAGGYFRGVVAGIFCRLLSAGVMTYQSNEICPRRPEAFPDIESFTDQVQ